MKHITSFFLLFFTFLLFSCNSEENISYITDNDYLNQNNIQDVVHIYCTTCVSDSTYNSTTEEVLIHGVRNNKFWFAVFKEDTKKLVDEWFCTMPESSPDYDYHHSFFTEHAWKLNNGCYVFNDGFEESTIYFLGEKNQAKQIYKTNYNEHIVFANEVVIALCNSNLQCTIVNINGEVLIDSADAGFRHPTQIQENEDVLFSKLHDDSLTIFALRLKNQYTTYATFKDKFNRNVQTDHGWGEIENSYITRFDIRRKHLFDNGGLCSVACYLDNDNLLCNMYIFNEKGIKVKSKLSYDEVNSENLFLNWYNESVLVLGKYVIDTDCQQLFEFADKLNLNYVGLITPISYTNAIRLISSTIYCSDKVNDKLIWERTIDKLEGFVNEKTRYEYKLLLEEEEFLKFHIKAVNYDGSKLEFDFLVDKSTGEITYL